ncbi:hypothetical protein ANCCAN_07772 [Ancylostoma caninum]|uniref:Secreted protein n=1 Tax=Ancylostoma caninum TaxID=29170 RepID=A0A368GPE8_ANCCA|nr:hypothetical protein ANCCAN_07772 [Ancylostoma caninum]
MCAFAWRPLFLVNASCSPCRCQPFSCGLRVRVWRSVHVICQTRFWILPTIIPLDNNGLAYTGRSCSAALPHLDCSHRGQERSSGTAHSSWIHSHFHSQCCQSLFPE